MTTKEKDAYILSVSDRFLSECSDYHLKQMFRGFVRYQIVSCLFDDPKLMERSEAEAIEMQYLCIDLAKRMDAFRE